MKSPRLPTLLCVLTLLPTMTLAASRTQRPATPSNELTLQQFLAVGKGSGACGILNLQLTFQETTQMTGGNEFIVRFWTTEAARLGMTLEAYAVQCTTTLSSYDKMWEMSDAK